MGIVIFLMVFVALVMWACCAVGSRNDRNGRL